MVLDVPFYILEVPERYEVNSGTLSRKVLPVPLDDQSIIGIPHYMSANPYHVAFPMFTAGVYIVFHSFPVYHLGILLRHPDITVGAS